MTPFEILVVALLAVVVVLQLIAMLRGKSGDASAMLAPLRDTLLGQHQQIGERTERELRNQIQGSAQSTRQELTGALAQFQQTLAAQLTSIATIQNNQIDSFAQQLAKLNEVNARQLDAMRQSI